MKERTVARRYAVALFRLAVEIGRLEEIDEQCRALETVFEDKELKKFLLQPQLGVEKKRAFLTKAFRDKIHPALFKLMMLLLEKGRIGLAAEVFDYFDLLTDRHRGIEEVTIVTALKADEEYVRRLTDMLKKFSDFPDLRVSTEVDESIIGGAKVYLGRHTVIDGSLSTRIQDMKEKLLVYRNF